MASRGLRGMIDGTVSVLLAGYLARLGLSPLAVGAIVTGTLVGSGVLTLGIGVVAHRFHLRRLLTFAALLMAATGVGFALSSDFWLLLAIAVVGTLNPSSGDISLFLPLEQASLAGFASDKPQTTALMARYNVIGTFAGALGALAVGLPEAAAQRLHVAPLAAERGVFWLYAVIGLGVALLYAKSPEPAALPVAPAPLAKSRAAVLKLSALFSLDSFGGGFVVQSLLALFLFRRFQLSLTTAGEFFFATSLAASLSQFVSPKLARRFGLIRTMVFTHIPANLLLMAAAFMPSLELTLLCLLLRASVSSMDVPARQAYVMSIVPPEERAAASSVTNVPRSLAAALAPALSGWLLEHSSFGWPLLLAGALKVTYDLLLLALFQRSEHAAQPS